MTGFDSFRYLDLPTRMVVKAWIAREPARPIPWTLPAQPLSAARVALVTSAAVAQRSDRPFDQDGERQNPWWGDPSYRVVPRDATAADVAIYHLHIDTRFAERDLDCVLPLARLGELVAAGEVGSVARSHYSFMGYQLDARELLSASVPAMIAQMKAEAVDVALLVPV